MKTSPTISKTLIIGSFLMIAFSLFSSIVSAKINRVELVRYKNSWIPKVELKEVKIVAFYRNTQSTVLCQMVPLNNKLTPFVQLNEITITPSSSYISSSLKIQPKNELLVQNKIIDGKYMPHVDLNEVTISAKKVSNTKDNVAITEASVDNEIIQLSVRKSFDRLANFLVIQGKTLLHKLIPGWFA